MPATTLEQVMDTPTKVYPLRPGIHGFNAAGRPVALQPGVPGWMPRQDATDAEERGDVDIMAGRTPQSLRTVHYETAQARAQARGNGTPVPDPDNALDEDPPSPSQVPQASPKRKRGRPRRDETYNRSDLRAEN